MPIVNTNRILQVEIGFKNNSKFHKEINYENIKPSDITVGYTSFQNSIFNTKNQSPNDIVEFIRNANIHSSTEVLISTKQANDEPTYDIYKLDIPPKKITTGLDNLYGSILLDLKNEIPKVTKGKYIDLEKINVTKHITDEKLELLQLIASNAKYGISSNYRKIIEDNNLIDLIETLEFLNLFYCEIIPKSSIDIETYEKVLKSMKAINSKEYKDLNNFYTMAKNNEKAYYRLSKLYNIVYNEPLHWIHNSKEKVKTKNTDKSRKIA